MSEDKRGAFLDLLEYVSEQIFPKKLFALASRFRNTFSIQQNEKIKKSCNARYQFLLELQREDILNEDKVYVLETVADYCRDSEQVRDKIKKYKTTYLDTENDAYDNFKKKLKEAIPAALVTQLAEFSGFDKGYYKSALMLIGSWEVTEYKPGAKMLSETDVSFVKLILGSVGPVGRVALRIVTEYEKSL